jgi:hypothetical protein
VGTCSDPSALVAAGPPNKCAAGATGPCGERPRTERIGSASLAIVRVIGCTAVMILGVAFSKEIVVGDGGATSDGSHPDPDHQRMLLLSATTSSPHGEQRGRHWRSCVRGPGGRDVTQTRCRQFHRCPSPIPGVAWAQPLDRPSAPAHSAPDRPQRVLVDTRAQPPALDQRHRRTRRRRHLPTASRCLAVRPGMESDC